MGGIFIDFLFNKKLEVVSFKLKLAIRMLLGKGLNSVQGFLLPVGG